MAMTSSDEAVPADGQGRSPCHDCPWRKTSIAGWLGGGTTADWIDTARSDAAVPCHALAGQQCAGIAIFRANIAKLPRDPAVLRLPADRETVFGTPHEFSAYHWLADELDDFDDPHDPDDDLHNPDEDE